MSDWEGIDVRENTVRMEAAGDDSRCQVEVKWPYGRRQLFPIGPDKLYGQIEDLAAR